MSETAGASGAAGNQRHRVHQRHRVPRCLSIASAVALSVGSIIAFAWSPADAQPLPAPPPVPAPVIVPVAPSAAAPGVIAPPAVAQTGPTPAVGVPLIPQAATAPAPAPAAVPAVIPATSGTLTEYFKSHNVEMEPQKPESFTALRFNLPVPRGWARVPDPNVPDAFLVTADRVGGDGLYTSNTQLIVYRLIGDFDPKEAISHGFIDSQKEQNWQTTNASMSDFGGNPSSFITGTFRQNDMMLNTARRHVILASGPDRYLVSLSVTTAVNQVVATGSATDAIVKGFQVSAAAPPGPAAPPAPPAPPAPALPAAPQG